MTTDEPRQGAGPTQLLALAAIASAGAGLVHAAAAGTHQGDPSLVRLFALTAAVQLGWAAVALTRPGRRTASVGLFLGAAALGAWIMSRTVGLPITDSLAAVEAVGTQDAIAAVLAGVSAALAAAALSGARLPAALGRSSLVAVGGVAVLALAVPGMVAEHQHSGSHAHGHGDEVAAEGSGHDHATEGGAGADAAAHHDAAAAADEGHGHGDAAAEPVTSLSDPRVTDEQRTAAQDLIDRTVDGMARFSTVESVSAAGYYSIGDASTGYEHFVSPAHMADGIELDPARIESIVFRVLPDGTRQLGSAMYILDGGSTMDDVPDIAGELTTWHDHQNLCWDGGRVVGVLDADGACTNGTFRPTAPMLHVWMLPHRCGPFAGIEGAHGAGCGHGHADHAGASTTTVPGRATDQESAEAAGS